MPIVTTNCSNCKNEIQLQQWQLNDRLKNNKGRGIFCSVRCSLFGRKPSQETVDKIIKGQKGVSILSRGRKGHSVSEETKDKIRQKKKGMSFRQDYDIVRREMEYQGIIKYANLTKRPIPDAVFVQDGKLIAVEVEKERWEVGIRQKMQIYENRQLYDKVILVWYTPEGERMKEWILENGEWNQV